MAGDHVCPVCSSTFTRPQHVARHMRSHTGDRPYKCQHCGDQFARSDLLSRHVNKCHASEKPPTTTAPSRKKGQAGPSSTRATTSKQACDQCVIATLPCDGCNPCGKCIQRKLGCTYVKFQRQTAPSGPGHKHNGSLDSLSSSGSAMSIPRAEDLFLAQPPMSVPSMGHNDMYYNIQSDRQLHSQSFAFNPQVSTGWDGNFDVTQPELTLSASAMNSMDNSYRMQPDLLRRTAMMPPSNTTLVGQTIVPGLYGQANQWNTTDQHIPTDASNNAHRLFDTQQLLNQQTSYTNIPNYGTSTADFTHDTNPFSYQPHGLEHGSGRRGSISSMSDASASSHQSSHLSFDFNPYSLDSGSDQQAPPSRDGRLALPFGSMSLEDAQAFGGFNASDLAAAHNQQQMNSLSDGSAPFFTGAAMKMPPSEATPRPMTSTTARDRDAETRELREFWKQYLRTPLTGPPLGMTPKAENNANQLGNPVGLSMGSSTGLLSPSKDKPSMKRGLSRVASLPSVRTPSEEKTPMAAFRYGVPNSTNNSINNILNGSSHHYNQVSMDDASRPKVSRDTDDLRTYEQALMARKANMNFHLNFAPKKDRAKRAGTNSLSPEVAPPSNNATNESAASVSSSPAVVQAPPHGGQMGGLLQVPNQDAGSGSGSDDGAMRPSFKRLPSQTLEPSHAKRHLYRWGTRGLEEAVEDTDSDADSSYARPNTGDSYGNYSDRGSRSGSVVTSFSEASGEGSNTSSLNGSPYLGNNLNMHNSVAMNTGTGTTPMNANTNTNASTNMMHTNTSNMRAGVPTGTGPYKVPELTQTMLMERYRRQSAPSGLRPNMADFIPLGQQQGVPVPVAPAATGTGIVGSG